jgi:hypothetical protein
VLAALRLVVALLLRRPRPLARDWWRVVALYRADGWGAVVLFRKGRALAVNLTPRRWPPAPSPS